MNDQLQEEEKIKAQNPEKKKPTVPNETDETLSYCNFTDLLLSTVISCIHNVEIA